MYDAARVRMLVQECFGTVEVCVSRLMSKRARKL